MAKESYRRRGRRGRRPLPKVKRLSIAIAMRENAAKVDRMTVAEIASAYGVSESTAYQLQNEFTRHSLPQMRRELELLENQSAPGDEPDGSTAVAPEGANASPPDDSTGRSVA